MTSNDSRIRIYSMKSYEQVNKYSGLVNETSQIRSSLRCGAESRNSGTDRVAMVVITLYAGQRTSGYLYGIQWMTSLKTEVDGSLEVLRTRTSSAFKVLVYCLPLAHVPKLMTMWSPLLSLFPVVHVTW